jgi:ATP-dependent exoDNAse (exonuclease V) alpha subunit
MNFLKECITILNLKQNLFLTGGAGVGKTTITREIIKYFESEAKKVAKLASTGMAATLIGGQTLHSFLDLGIASNVEELENNNKLEIKKKIKKLIFSMDLIVIDEISMVSDTLFEMIILRLTQADFQGSLLVVGDFLQLPPVVKSNDVHFAFESSQWQFCAFKKIELTHIYRTDDKRFIELLHHIRFGYVDETIHNHLNEFIKPLPNDLSKSTFLFGKNITATHHNNKQLSTIDSDLLVKEIQIIKHITSTKDSECERFIKDARIDKEFVFKIGAPILFTRNAWNYFNGERGIIINVDETKIHIQKDDGKVVKLEAIAQTKEAWQEKVVDGKKEIIQESIFSVYHYPIKLAFGITIHKSQGMSIENLIIQTNEIFAPSQFYVALSRSSNPKNLNLIAPRKQWYNLAYVNERAMAFVKNDTIAIKEAI